MEKFIQPNGNLNIRLYVTPVMFFGEDSLIETCILIRDFGRLREDIWVKITPDLKSKYELMLLIDGLILELGRAREQVNKLYKDAKEGRITEEFFNNQKDDSEKF